MFLSLFNFLSNLKFSHFLVLTQDGPFSSLFIVNSIHSSNLRAIEQSMFLVILKIASRAINPVFWSIRNNKIILHTFLKVNKLLFKGKLMLSSSFTQRSRDQKMMTRSIINRLSEFTESLSREWNFFQPCEPKVKAVFKDKNFLVQRPWQRREIFPSDTNF